MKLSEENIYKLEHELIRDLVIWETMGTEYEDKIPAYVAGAHDMANMVVKAIKEIQGR